MLEQKYSFIGVDPLVFHEGKLLLAQRGEDAGAEEGKWHIPGALVKADETLEQACQRAILEKTNLRISLVHSGSVQASYVGIYDSINREPRYRDIAISLFCQLIGDSKEMRPGPRMKRVDLFTPDQVEKLDFGFDHRQIALDGIRKMRL